MVFLQSQAIIEKTEINQMHTCFNFPEESCYVRTTKRTAHWDCCCLSSKSLWTHACLSPFLHLGNKPNPCFTCWVFLGWTFLYFFHSSMFLRFFLFWRFQLSLFKWNGVRHSKARNSRRNLLVAYQSFWLFLLVELFSPIDTVSPNYNY